MTKLSYILIALLIFSGCMEDKNAVSTVKGSPKQEITETAKTSGNARIKTVHGDIVVKFFPKDAPNTVSRIKTLIKDGFYNGLIFHRVIPGFVAQGGDPTGTGFGGSGKKIKAEFNKRKHVPGTLSMARSNDINSADSQFYISLGTLPHLDNKYTVFGQVTEGLNIASKILKGDKMISVTLE